MAYTRGDADRLFAELCRRHEADSFKVEQWRDFKFSVDVHDVRKEDYPLNEPLIVVACQPEIPDRGQVEIFRTADETVAELNKLRKWRAEGIL